MGDGITICGKGIAGDPFRLCAAIIASGRETNHNVTASVWTNVYSGVATTDVASRAIVTLPTYSSTAESGPLYQLTISSTTTPATPPIQPSALSAWVAGELGVPSIFGLAPNQFLIQTNVPDTKVYWQVTTTRQDAWAKDH